MIMLQVTGSLTQGFQGSFLLMVVLSLTIHWVTTDSLALEATQTCTTFLTLVWIQDLSQMVWLIAHLGVEMDSAQVMGDVAFKTVDCWRRIQAICILTSTGATRWGIGR